MVAVIMGVGGAKAGTQEFAPHPGPTAADRGYTAGELSWPGTTPLGGKSTGTDGRTGVTAGLTYVSEDLKLISGFGTSEPC
jgi:hypothetical protein